MKLNQGLVAKPSNEFEVQKPVASISQETFAPFILGHPYSIIWATKGDGPDSFPFGITFKLGVAHEPTVGLGVLDLSSVDWTPSVQLLNSLVLERLGLKADGSGLPPAGYYLFARNTPLGFHSGQIDLDKDGEVVGWGALTGFIGLIAEKKEFVQLGRQVATLKAGERVAKKFGKLIEAHEAQSSSAP